MVETEHVRPDSEIAPIVAERKADRGVGGDITPVSGTRKVIFERMAASHRSAARVTQFLEVDATKLVALRKNLNVEAERYHRVTISYNDLLILFTARALEKHLFMNSTLTEQGIVTQKEINIGLAVETEHGLVVPVVRNAEKLRLLDITRKVQELIEKTRNGTASTDDLSGGTFTITNLGMYDIDGFTPIINPPESAILGVGRISEQPAVYKGEITIRQMVILSLTFDHRIIDGGPAARFLKSLRNLIEEPILSMV
jgi:pyruvate dehydrogenase E2 component (dihydrolipoamide acetyltransferase)